MSAPIHVYEIFVKASPSRVWQAITEPEYTRRYFHRTAIESTFEPGAGYRYVMADGRDAVDGTIEEVETDRRLVMTWHTLYDASLAAEPVSRVEWTLAPANDDATVTRVTLRHLDLARSPGTWANVRLGWVGVLDSMKTFLETGEELGDVDTDERPADAVSAGDVLADWHRAQGVEANNSTWELLDAHAHTPEEADDLLARAYASAYHWSRAAGRQPVNAARAAWLVSRAHVVLGHGELALHHADQCAATCASAGLDDFDLAYAHEARARAYACLGRLDEARVERKAARAVDITDAEDRATIESDLAAEPWFGLSDD
jgi:uncharacterized protein YndB with AHSA1/START domain